MDNKYLQKIHIKEDSIDELDFVLQDEFETDPNDRLHFIEVGKGSVYTHVINIDTFVKMLQDLKDQGATHIEMDYHEDHIGYDISAFEIRLSTEEEILSYVMANNAKREKDLKREELQRQLRELDDNIGEYANDDLPF